MAEFSDIGVPGISEGILMPKLKNQFQVRVKAEDGETLHGLSKQVVAVTKLTENPPTFGLGVGQQGSFILIVEDDVTSSAVQDLDKIKISNFVTCIDVFDGGNNVIETIEMSGCSVTSIRYGDFDYCPQTKVPIFKIDVPSAMRGPNYCEEYPEFYALFRAMASSLSGTSLTFGKEAVIEPMRHSVVVSFEEMKRIHKNSLQE